MKPAAELVERLNSIEQWLADMGGIDTDAYARTICEARASLSALKQAEAGVPVVKALEWRLDGTIQAHRADTDLCGIYLIYNAPGGWVATGKCSGQIGQFKTVPEAKAAAQADYERRIRSALYTRPTTPQGKATCKDGLQVGAAEAGSQAPVSGELDFATSIARVTKEEAEAGAAAGWRSCTGCHETNEGAETGWYPYSKTFGCFVGAGCTECGGIGVVWEYWSKDELHKHLIDDPAAPVSEPAQPSGVAVKLAFRPSSELPDVPKGHMRACVIMYRSKHTGKNHTMPAYYLNAYPLEFEDGCGDPKCEDEHYDGCPVSGWFYDNANFEYENCYHRIEGECLFWALIPDATAVETCLAALTQPVETAPSPAPVVTDDLPTREEAANAAKVLLRCNGHDLTVWGAEDLIDDGAQDALRALEAVLSSAERGGV